MRAGSKSRLWQISLATTAEAEEACIEALSAEFGVPASGYTDFETQAVRVSAYLETKPKLLTQRINGVRARLRAGRAGGLRIGTGRIECRPMKRENWAESWKRHFKPLSIGGAVLLKPSWSRRQAKARQAVVVLDPGLSFGTGHHATTSFCLREVVRFCRKGGGSFLDMGTGSGILAIVAAKLNCKPITAFDFDPEAVRVARKNALNNRVQDRIRIDQADVTKLPLRPVHRFDLVCANLISNLLLAERKQISTRVAEGGTLVLAGILRTEFSGVRKAFEKLGMQLVRQKHEKEWASGAFVRQERGKSFC
jgi:ribosomal protein L11 methyltransferase